jgi:small conductance mechanosensitive channel
MLAVRPYCHNEHYWQVYFDTNRMIRETLEEAGFHTAEQPIVVRTSNGTVMTSPAVAAAGRSL